jgi:aspartyl-tRNA(Asn)/glutamyl-tRNA(Gln) amidotransferase subunit B
VSADAAGTDYEVRVGLEIHCQLATASKLFCACANRFGAEPNSLLCPVCAGLPGALPLPNADALDLALRAALALGSSPAPCSIFERKHYAYPDLPKGYQITQYAHPLASGGELALESGARVRLVRVHVEEDAGKLIHDRGDRTLVDLNRAGLPLIEIVSQPDLRSGEQAAEFLLALRECLQYAGVSQCDMEKGELRCDVNVSVAPPGSSLGTKVEVKNLNSVRHVRAAVEYEYARQVALLRSGQPVRQETRSFEPEQGVTRALRGKEEARDYRYFPDPDLPPCECPPAALARARAGLGESAAARRARYREHLGLSESQARTLTGSRALADFFEAVSRHAREPRAVANWVANDVLALLSDPEQELGSIDALAFKPYDLAQLIELVAQGRLSNAAARKVLAAMAKSGRSPQELARELGLEQASDPALLRAWCQAALAAQPKAAQAVRGGELKALGPIIAAALQQSGGKAHPGQLKDVLLELLRGDA